jgi:hypothetical protein
MELVIDLSDPTVQAQLAAAIDAKLGELTTDRINSTVVAILSTRTERLSDAKIAEIVDRRVEVLVQRRLDDYFGDPYGGISQFRRDMLPKIEALLKTRIVPLPPTTTGMG